jgi:hypothetical protein
MAAFSVGDIVSVEVSEGKSALGEICGIAEDGAQLGAYYFLEFTEIPGKYYQVVSYKESCLTFIATKEQYLLTNPEFFL